MCRCSCAYHHGKKEEAKDEEINYTIMLTPSIKKNDKQAKVLILTVSFVVFAVVALLSRVQLKVDLGFDVHIFALANAVINSIVTVLLIWAMVAIRQKSYELHKKLMLFAMFLSILFLVSYIAHHLLAGETKYGGDGTLKTIYYIILATHIPLAAVILPFILFTAYRSLIGEFDKHKKLARYTWPLWLYVSITGVLVYIFISPYYS
jgi:putative membrane protein